MIKSEIWNEKEYDLKEKQLTFFEQKFAQSSLSLPKAPNQYFLVQDFLIGGNVGLVGLCSSVETSYL